VAAEPVSVPTSAELRAALEQAAGWIARYLDGVDRLPVMARVEAGRHRRRAAGPSPRARRVA